MKKLKIYAQNKKELAARMVSKLKEREITDDILEKMIEEYLISISKDKKNIINENTFETLDDLFGDMLESELKEYAVQSINTLILIYDGILVSQVESKECLNMKEIADSEYELIHDAKYYLLELVRRIRIRRENLKEIKK